MNFPQTLLKQHEKEAHGIGVTGQTYQCSLCGHTFPTKHRHEKHLRSCETGQSRIGFRKQHLDSLEWMGKGCYRCKLCEIEIRKDSSWRSSLQRARSHLVVDHGMKHLKRVKMDWVNKKKKKNVGPNVGANQNQYKIKVTKPGKANF